MAMSRIRPGTVHKDASPYVTPLPTQLSTLVNAQLAVRTVQTAVQAGKNPKMPGTVTTVARQRPAKCFCVRRVPVGAVCACVFTVSPEPTAVPTPASTDKRLQRHLAPVQKQFSSSDLNTII